MSSCVSSATSTQFGTFTSNSVSTSFSSSVTTLPGSVTTIASTSCLASSTPTGTGGGSPSCISSTVIESVSTIPGSVSTAQVPIVTTIPVVVTQATATLFGSSCSDGGSTDNNSPTPPTTSPTSTPTDSPTTSPNSPNSSNPSPTTPLVTTGSTTITIVTGGTTLISVSPISSVQPDSGSNGGHSSSNLGPILGGIFGGVFGLVLIVGVIWWILRRRSRWDDIFDEKEGYEDTMGADGIQRSRSRSNMLDTEFAADANTEPKPYEYGLVGSGRPLSPPSENAGVRPVNQPSMHGRSLSDAPLLMNNVASGSSTSHLITPSGTSHASRPSTSSSYFLPGQGPSDVGHSPRHTGGFANAPGSGAAPIVPSLPSPPTAGAVANSSSAQQPTSTHGGPGSPTRNSTAYEESLLGSPVQQHRTLFVANQLDNERVGSPPISPKAAAFSTGKKRESASAASRTSGDLGTGSSSPRPMSPQRQSTSAVIVHRDAGRASSDVPARPTNEEGSSNTSSGASGSGGEAPPPAYAE